MPAGEVGTGGYQIGARRAARLVKLSWSTLLYKSRKEEQEPLRRRLREMAARMCGMGTVA